MSSPVVQGMHTVNCVIIAHTGQEKFDLTQDMILKGIGKPHATYIDITAEVCKRACSEIHGDSCCSLVYDRGTRTCLITPLELNATGVSLVPELYTDYYRRTKCEGKNHTVLTIILYSVIWVHRRVFDLIHVPCIVKIL